MAPTKIVGEHSYGDSTLLPLGLYKNIKPRQTMSAVPSPIFRDGATINRWAPPDHGLETLAFTDIAFEWRFDSVKPWKQNGGTWQFQASELVLKATILVYVDSDISPNSSQTTRYSNRDLALSIVLSHEYDHVQDEIDVITTGLPQLLREHKDIRRMLIDDGNGQPAQLSDAEYKKWFVEIDGTVERGGSEHPKVVGSTRFDGLLWDLHANAYNKTLKSTDHDSRHYYISLALTDLKRNRKPKWPI